MLAALANYTNITQQHMSSLENAVTTLGNELSYHSEALLRQVHLHDQELSRVMVNHYSRRRDPAQFVPV